MVECHLYVAESKRYKNSHIVKTPPCDIRKQNPFSHLVIACSDTDVLLLLLHYYDELCISTIFQTSSRSINLTVLHTNLGPALCKTLLRFHALTGCDQTGKFAGFTKITCWKALLEFPESVKDALKLMGSEVVTDTVKKGLEEFVLPLYCKNHPPPPSVSDLPPLRWMFSKYQSENERLPPTSATFLQKILRANYITLLTMVGPGMKRMGHMTLL